MKYFLDTNTIVYYVKGMYPKLVDHFRSVNANDIFLPSVVAAEIEYGARKSVDYDKTIQIYRPFLTTFRQVPFGGRAQKIYGEVRADLERRGMPIGPNDLLIASIALSADATLVTANVKEFSRVDGLRIEDWTK